MQDVATTLYVLVGGQKVSDYYEGGEQVEVRVRAEERDRSSAAGPLFHSSWRFLFVTYRLRFE